MKAKTRILFLSFYYTPDLSAGSFRAEALVNALLENFGEHVEIDVVTTEPNRYHTFKTAAPNFEKLVGLTIRRVSVPAHKSGLFDQALAFGTFAYKVIKITKDTQYDLIFATSSRLMTASLAAYLSHKTKAKLYLDIRDIFVDTLQGVLSPTLAKIASAVFSIVEKLTIKQADKINLISPGFSPYFNKRYPEKKFTYYTNGIDDIFISSQKPPIKGGNPSQEQRVLKVVYAGNIGTGQGLHLIIPKLAKHLEGEAEFHLIGSGGALEKLKKSLLQDKVTNVFISPPVKRESLLDIYLQADILFLHLNNIKAFRRVLPSKLFEYAATQKPILAGLSGYPGRFANKRIDNIAIFSPCDVDGAIQSLQKLELGDTLRGDFVKRFSRISIKRKMAIDLLTTCPKYHPIQKDKK